MAHLQRLAETVPMETDTERATSNVVSTMYSKFQTTNVFVTVALLFLNWEPYWHVNLDQSSTNYWPIACLCKWRFTGIPLHPFVYTCLRLLTHYKSTVEQWQQKPSGLQSLKYLLSGLLQKKFANPCPDACHMPICLQMSYLAKTAQSRVPDQINMLGCLKYRNSNY